MPSRLLKRKIDALRKRLGSDPLNSNVIEREGAAMFGHRWGGVMDQKGFAAADRKPDRFFIVNTSYSPQSRGVHWVGVYITRDGISHIYDSFGRDVDHLLSRAGIGHTNAGHSVEANGKGDQNQSSALCGHYSLAWLDLVKEQGVRAANTATK